MRLILVDIDIPWEIMEKYRFFDILNDKVEYCLSKFNVDAKIVNVSRSQCGNTHLHIVLKQDVNAETIIKIKFCIGEDPKRLTHSIRRYEKTGKILDFFWIRKVKECDEKEE